MKKLSFLLTAAAFCAAALAAAAARADRLDTVVTLGSTATATVTVPDDVATVGFLVTSAGKKLTFAVKRTKGSTLAPVVKLIAPNGNELDIATNGGSVVAKPTSWSAKLPTVPLTGLWRLEVRGATGTTGGFTAQIKGTDVLSLKSSKTSPPAIQVGGKQDIEIFAGDSMAVTVAVARASGNKSLVPQLAILDSYGLPLSATPVAVGSDKSGALSLKAYRLPLFGKYTLRFTGKGNTGGSFSYSITTAPAKLKGTLPTADAGAATEAEPGLVTTLNGSSTTPGPSFRWTQVSGPAVTLNGVTTGQPTFTAPEVVAPAKSIPLAFQLSVSQNGILSKPMTVGVEIAKRPIADAGRSAVVASSATVGLDGTASYDRRAKGLRFVWRQIPGDDATVTLSSASAATPTFTAPAGNHTLHFGLTVDDGNARSFEDVVVVQVGTGTPSVADAGREQYVPRMSSVVLCGFSSTTASGVLDGGLQWTQVAGPPVTLSSATSPWPSFTAPRTSGDLVFELKIDGATATADRVAVRVRPYETNVPAAADGNGPLNAPAGDVALSASATVDPEGDTLRYRWTQIAGPALPVTSANAVTATAALPAGNNGYVFAVMANDGLQYGTPDLVALRNSGYIGLPIAVAGDDRSVISPTFPTPPVPVQLNGLGSARTDGQPGGLTYEWTQLSGLDWFNVTTSPVAWDPASATPQFLLPADVSSLTPTRSILFQLVVNDGTNASLPDFVLVTFKKLPLNGRPVVTAGASDPNPVAGGPVTLQGAASDHDNDPMTYEWTQTSGPGIQLTPNAKVLSPSFNAPASGTLVFQLVADDGFDESKAATVTITVDQKPTATVKVTPTSGSPGTTVTMDGSTSLDPENALLTYLWTQTSGTTVGGLNLTAPALQFQAPIGTVVFRLVVSDGRQSSAPATGSFSGNPPPTVSPSASLLDSTYGASYGSTVTLNANVSGGGGTITYTWRQINPNGTDPTVSTLSSTSVASPTFTAPTPTSAPFGISPQVTFGVIASDGLQSSPEGTITIKLFASLNNNNGSGSTTKTVYSIVSLNCTSCHSGTANTYTGGSGNNATFYGLATKTAFLNNSRGQNAYATGAKKRLPGAGVTGASTTNAYFFDRLQGTGGIMPPTGSLATSDKNLIQDWIDQGVQDN